MLFEIKAKRFLVVLQKNEESSNATSGYNNVMRYNYQH